MKNAELDLNELKEKALAATPGPWYPLPADGTIWDKPDDCPHEPRWEEGCDCELGNIIASTGERPRDDPMMAPNTAYIATVSPDVVLALIDRLEIAEKRLAERA